MNIYIAGCGRVGYHLARLLCADRQDVTVIDVDPDRVEQIDYALDVSTATGSGASAMFLQSLGVGNADLFVAAMGNDETNLISAATAKGLGAKQAVARLDTPAYIESSVLYETILGIDYILSPEALAALEIANYIENPGVLASEEFGRGLALMRQIRVVASAPANGQALKDLMAPGSGVLLAVINRGGGSVIPHGDTVIEALDQVTLLGHRHKVADIQRLFQGREPKPQRIAIMGGAAIGFRVAQALEDKVRTVKLFERREERCNALAANLRKAKVVCRDATSRVSLEQEHLGDFDVFVAATGDDERNIMAGVLAKEVGLKMVISVVHQPDFAPIVQRLGIDMAVTPRACIANRILRLVHQGQVTSLAVLGEGQIEVLEFAMGDGSPVLGRKLKDFKSKFPRGALIACILRGEQVIVPGGEDEIHAGDSVILVASSDSVDAARKLLQRKR